MTDPLREKILSCESKTELEDLYLPYKPKRRTRGQIAIEAGLEPLAEMLWQNPSLTPEEAARAFVNAEKGVADEKAALDGARYILMERFSEDAELLAKLRQYLTACATLESHVIEGKESEGEKFRDYFEHSEPFKQVPSKIIPTFRSLISSTPSIKTAVLNSPRGSRPGFSNSLKISSTVGKPNCSSTKSLACS